MLFEQLLLIIPLSIAIYFIGIPIFKLVKKMIPQKKDPIAEAKAKLEQARAEAEAAKLLKQTEQVYKGLYEEALTDDEAVQPQAKEQVK